MVEHESPYFWAPTILLVEDDELVMEVTRSMLEINGYRVVSTFLPSVALNLVTRGDLAVDLLVTDVVMPQMNGPELYRRIQKQKPDLPVLYISGYSGEVINGIMEDKNVDVLSKPFALASFLERIEKKFA